MDSMIKEEGIESDIKVAKMVILDLEKDLEADYLVRPAEHLKERATKIVAWKKRQIEALENIIQRMEDLYE